MPDKNQKLSLADARYLAIYSQRLAKLPSKSSKRELLNIIEHLSYVQIDTLSIVERSHHHILWSRMPGYKKNMLEELHNKDKKIFEYWGHAAAYLPMKDYKYSLVRKYNYAKKYKDWKSKNRKLIKFVYDRIKNEGPLQSRNFLKDINKKGKTEDKNGWWSWKPAKEALEYLFHSGKLMVAKRSGFQKVYDLTERFLPAGIDTNLPTAEEYSEHIIMNAVNSHGFISGKEITYLRAKDPVIFSKALNLLCEKNELIRITLENSNDTYFSTKNNLKAINRKSINNNLHILSPFDNLIIQRKRLKTLFNYDFQVEFYLPESKRKYGYFCMPVLWGDKFIGRVDAKADRSIKTLIIKNFFMETKNKLTEEFNSEFQQELHKLAIFTGCEKVQLTRLST